MATLFVATLIGGALAGKVTDSKSRNARDAVSKSAQVERSIRGTRTPILGLPKANTLAGSTTEGGFGLDYPVQPHPGNRDFFNMTFSEEVGHRAARFKDYADVGYLPTKHTLRKNHYHAPLY